LNPRRGGYESAKVVGGEKNPRLREKKPSNDDADFGKKKNCSYLHPSEKQGHRWGGAIQRGYGNQLQP